MHDALSHGQSEPLFYQTHLTDGEIASLADLALKTIYHYRSEKTLAPGKRILVERIAYSGRRVRIKKNFTPIEDVRTWFILMGRDEALVALNALVAAKQAEADKLSEQGE